MKTIFVSKLTLLCLIASLAFIHSHAQVISNVDFDEVKKQIEDPQGDYFYPTLLDNYFKADYEIKIDEAYFLYYGFVMQPQYNPYAQPKLMDKFNSNFDKKKYEKALALGPELIAESPFNTEILGQLVYCARLADREVERTFYLNRVLTILEVIQASGDGKTAESAWVVIQVDDEYGILSFLDYDFKGQALVGHCDVMTIDTPNDFGQSEVYFNIEKPFEGLSKMFQK
jgi:Domain of unknown function (DUF4919)